MRDAQRRLSNGFLILLSLPTAAIGFCLSSAVASTTWLLSTRYDLHLENIALIWLMGPLMGLLVQPVVGWLSDRSWWLGGRRRPYLIAGGTAGALATFALLELDTLSAATGLSLMTVAVFVVLVSDLATNVTFNPARSLVADLTPEGPHRVRGYAWMQVVSGVFGISAYLVSIVFGNEVLLLTTVAVTFMLTVVPVFFLEEPRPPAPTAIAPEVADPGGVSTFKALWPMAGFALYGAYVAVDRGLLDHALTTWALPLFFGVLGLSIAWGAARAWRGRVRPSAELRLGTLLLAHGFAWLGVQALFVMSFFYVRDVVVAGAHGPLMADAFYAMWSDSVPAAADSAGRVLSVGFLLMNVVGALLPVLVLKPLCERWGKVAVHRAAMGTMALAFAAITLAPPTEAYYYLGMLGCGIGWSSLISIVFAIFSESVDSRQMGMSMGVFNSSLVLPALVVPGLVRLTETLDLDRGVFLLFAASLLLSFVFWMFVTEHPPHRPTDPP
ncbi:MAG: MFS transporter [Ahniella sp.]|nr:MFS transporter [Ahniella sp.]